jgi:hypothetical protein
MNRWIGRYKQGENTYQMDMKLHTDIKLPDVVEVMKSNVPDGAELIIIATLIAEHEFGIVWENKA